VADYPEVSQYQCDLARSLDNEGSLYHTTGRTADAEKVCQDALALRERLVREHPDVTAYQVDLIKSHNNLGMLYRALGKKSEAGNAARRTLSLCQRLAEQHPEVEDYQNRLAISYYNLAGWYQQDGKSAEAGQAVKDALSITEGLARSRPEVIAYQLNLARWRHGLGTLCHQADQLPEAKQHFQDTITIQERLVKQQRNHLEYAVHLCFSYNSLGDVLRDSGDPEGALPLYGRSIQDLNEVLTKVPQRLNAKGFLVAAHGGRAEALGQLGRHAEAIPDWDRAIELSDGKARGPYRLKRAAALARAGNHAQATHEVDDLALGQRLVDTDYYALAAVSSLAAGVVIKDAQLPEAERSRLLDQYATRAMDLLRQAVAKGYQNVEQLQSDRDFDPLRSRESFQKLLAELQEKKKATP
jgi:tetratricopeptide (TPR) repeat protein